MNSNKFNQIFAESIAAYHTEDNVDQTDKNPYSEGSIEYLLFRKNWIDTVQWHLEDIIRLPQIEPSAALLIKRRIDKSNQDRTDLVEDLDDYFFAQYSNVPKTADARLNTETPGWAIDRLSILNLKIYHMQQEVERTDATDEHKSKCAFKLNILLQQQTDLSKAIDELLEDLQTGKRIANTYKQMKMYNDPELNPVLRGTK